MAENIIMKGLRYLGQQIANALPVETIAAMERRQKYYEGDQRRPLKLKAGQADDNLISNFISLAVDRSNSMLFGGGVKFTTSGGEESQEYQYLQDVWQANKKAIFLHRLGQDGEIFGTNYIEIVPEYIPYKDKLMPRLVLLKPSLMSIETDELDMDVVKKYIFEYKYQNEDKVVIKITRRANADGEEIKLDDGVIMPVDGGNWIIDTYVIEGNRKDKDLVSSVPWLYDFPPILHFQNLPSIHDVYGVSGLGGGLDVQDKYNFVMSNMLKIVRYHAHPKTWGRGIPSNSNGDKASWGGDEMIKFSSTEAEIKNLEMQSDLASSRAILQDLRETVFNLARVPDMASMKDKIGALTNFGLRVLYSDALSKNATRRALYGDALQELNRRLLILGNFPETDNDVVWGSDMPADEKEDAGLVLADLAAGIVSKQTASERRGYTWKTSNDGQITGEQDKIAEEAATGGNIANNALLDLFTGRQTP